MWMQLNQFCHRHLWSYDTEHKKRVLSKTPQVYEDFFPDSCTIKFSGYVATCINEKYVRQR